MAADETENDSKKSRFSMRNSLNFLKFSNFKAENSDASNSYSSDEQDNKNNTNRDRDSLRRIKVTSGLKSEEDNLVTYRGAGEDEDFDAQIPASIKNKEMWRWQFLQMDLPGMVLRELTLHSVGRAEILKAQQHFKRARRDFMKYVAFNHRDELLRAGVLPEGIESLRNGKSPENFNVHVKVPFEYGGTIDFSNLIIIQTHPYHDEIHRFIDMQMLQYPKGKKAKLVYMPIPAGKVYLTGQTAFSSGGGLNRSDRSIFANWTNETFSEISYMGLLGRSEGSR